MKMKAVALFALIACGSAQAASEQVTIHQVTAEGIGKSLGTVKIDETQYGLQFTPDLQGLQPGIHGFHVHAKGSCEPGESEGKWSPPVRRVVTLIRPTAANIWGLMQRGTRATCPRSMSMTKAAPLIRCWRRV